MYVNKQKVIEFFWRGKLTDFSLGSYCFLSPAIATERWRRHILNGVWKQLLVQQAAQLTANLRVISGSLAERGAMWRISPRHVALSLGQRRRNTGPSGELIAVERYLCH